MSDLTLKRYLFILKHTKASFAKEIGRTPQNVAQWITAGAMVELTEAGIRIKTEKIVHESQVSK